MVLSNFEHLKQYPDIYEKCITDEKSLIEAYDLDNPNKTQLITIAGAMRGGLYGIVKHMVKKMQITDNMVIAYKSSHGMNSPDRVDNFGKLRVLEDEGAFDRSIADIAHRIRKIGNDANHFMEGQHSMFDNMSAQETLAVVEEMYEKLYFFSCYFTNHFMRFDFDDYLRRRRAPGASSSTQENSELGDGVAAFFGGFILVAAGFVIFLILKTIF